MTLSAGLLLYACLLGVVLDRLLARAAWPERSPRAALWLWHATASGVIGALTWALILFAHDAAEHVFAAVLSADKSLLHAAYAAPGEVPWYWNLSLALVIGGLITASVVASRRLLAMRRTSASHHLAVSRLLAIPSPEGSDDIVGVVDTVMPAVYCLGTAGHGDLRIHVTSGALKLLTDNELQAAVAHERGHLHNRHHRTLVVVDALAAAVKWFGLLRSYPAAVRRLIELEADDYAAARCGRLAVAGALLSMSASPSSSAAPSTAHSWTGGDPARRIRRLIQCGPTRPDPAGTVSVLASMLLVLTPFVSSLGPAVSLSGTEGVVSHHNEPAAGFDHH